MYADVLFDLRGEALLNLCDDYNEKRTNWFNVECKKLFDENSSTKSSYYEMPWYSHIYM